MSELYRDFIDRKADQIINGLGGTITPAPGNAELYRDFLDRKFDDVINSIDNVLPIGSASGNPATFYTSLVKPLVKLKGIYNEHQTGSGVPTFSNIRDFMPINQFTIDFNNDVNTISLTNNYNQLAFDDNEVKCEKTYITFDGSESWARTSTNIFRINLDPHFDVINGVYVDMTSNCAKYHFVGESTSLSDNEFMWFYGTKNLFVRCDLANNDLTTFKGLLNTNNLVIGGKLESISESVILPDLITISGQNTIQGTLDEYIPYYRYLPIDLI